MRLRISFAALVLFLSLGLSSALVFTSSAYAQGGPWDIDNNGFAVPYPPRGGSPGGGGPGTPKPKPRVSFIDFVGACVDIAVFEQPPYGLICTIVTGHSPLDWICYCFTGEH